jgi:hypothetical protein
MKRHTALSFVAVMGLLVLCPAARPSAAQDKQPPTVKIPDAGVPQIATIEGTYVRAAYNNEGYVIIGYRAANGSVGEEWLMLDTGMTLREKEPSYKLTRDAISLTTPDGGTIPLPSIEEYRKADVRALQNRSRTMRDSINYFPPTASRACRIGFFSNVESGAHAWEEVELDRNRGCLGELYFKIPGGIKYGQHFLNVKFQDSVIRVPFRILTKDEEKTLDKHYKSIRQQVKDAFAPPKKGGL